MDKPWKLYKILQRAPKSPFRGPFTPADHSYNNNQIIKDADKKASERLIIKGHLKFNYEYFYGICQVGYLALCCRMFDQNLFMR